MPNPLDPRYTNPERMRDVGGPAFYTGGTQNWHFSHKTTSYTGKLDLTSQITPIHQIKAGVEFNYHTLNYQDYQIHVDATSGFKPALPAPGSFDYNVYKNHPVSTGSIRSGQDRAFLSCRERRAAVRLISA